MVVRCGCIKLRLLAVMQKKKSLLENVFYVVYPS